MNENVSKFINTDLSCVLFSDRKWYHVIAHIIRLSATINKQESWNHGGLVFTHNDGKKYIFEVVKAGGRIIPLAEKLQQFKGITKEFALLETPLKNNVNIYTILQPLVEKYQYSVREAVGAYHFKNRLLACIFNKLLRSLRNSANNSTYCIGGMLYAMEAVNIEVKSTMIAEILHLVAWYRRGNENITPAEFNEIAICAKDNLIYRDYTKKTTPRKKRTKVLDN